MKEKKMCGVVGPASYDICRLEANHRGLHKDISSLKVVSWSDKGLIRWKAEQEAAQKVSRCN